MGHIYSFLLKAFYCDNEHGNSGIFITVQVRYSS